MSEPLTLHEIEDVLSSIRRLVSEDLRPARAAMAAAQSGKPVAVGADTDKLMLTPALRIVPVMPPEMPPEPPAQAAGQATGPEGPAQKAVDSFLGADLAAVFPPAEIEIEIEIEPDFYDDVGVKDDWPALSGPEALEDDVIWAAPGAVGHGASPSSVGSAAPGHWTANALPGLDWVDEGQEQVEPEPILFLAHPRKPHLSSDPLVRAEVEMRAEPGTAGAARAAAAPRTAVHPATDPAPLAEAPQSPGQFDGDQAELDEGMLRDIIRDLVREELAGALGERITRNVRKLVRVEINRALSAREFD